MSMRTLEGKVRNYQASLSRFFTIRPYIFGILARSPVRRSSRIVYGLNPINRVTGTG
jgi:hypothetical protein